jgi:hypothetical protein
MEHSLLHGLQICGLIFALGGVLFQLLVLDPAVRQHSDHTRAKELEEIARRWIFRAALGLHSEFSSTFLYRLRRSTGKLFTAE